VTVKTSHRTNVTESRILTVMGESPPVEFGPTASPHVERTWRDVRILHEDRSMSDGIVDSVGVRQEQNGRPVGPFWILVSVFAFVLHRPVNLAGPVPTCYQSCNVPRTS
jgi:hypothetical protein